LDGIDNGLKKLTIDWMHRRGEFFLSFSAGNKNTDKKHCFYNLKVTWNGQGTGWQSTYRCVTCWDVEYLPVKGLECRLEGGWIGGFKFFMRLA
jgi:hypothetical protein